MKSYYAKGFTLIELLVVIAIIGVLSSVVLASLNTARGKGTNSAIKASLANARAQAEIYYDNPSMGNSTYTSVCTAAGGIAAMLKSAADAGNYGAPVTVAGTAGTGSTVICHDSANAWAAAAPLKSPDSGTWCVDSTGASVAKGSYLQPSIFTCS